jgi:hypothetical protein
MHECFPESPLISSRASLGPTCLPTEKVRRGLASIWHEVKTAAGGLPVVLWAFATLAMLWADVSWSERLDGLRGFHKLIFISVLFAQLRHSDRAKWASLRGTG